MISFARYIKCLRVPNFDSLLIKFCVGRWHGGLSQCRSTRRRYMKELTRLSPGLRPPQSAACTWASRAPNSAAGSASQGATYSHLNDLSLSNWTRMYLSVFKMRR